MKALLIWELIPESTNFYLIDATPEQVELLKLTNGCHMNSTHFTPEQMVSWNFINNAICEKIEDCYDGDPKDYCIWKDCKVNTPIEQEVSLVVNCGFLL